MKSEKIKEKFIEMRAKRISYEKISRKLNTSTRTLINWSRELKSEIQNLRQIKKESLLKQFRLTEVERLKRLKELQNKLSNELNTRTLESIPTVKLIDLNMKMLNDLGESEDIEFMDIEEGLIDGTEKEIKWKS